MYCLRGLNPNTCPIVIEQGQGFAYCQVCADGYTEEEVLTEPFISQCPYCGNPMYNLYPHPTYTHAATGERMCRNNTINTLTI